MKKAKEEQKAELILRDKLALDRTVLANERTLLSYFRSFVVVLSSGIAILKVELFEEIEYLGILLVTIAPILLVIGLARFIYVKKRIKSLYNFQKNN